MTVSSRDHTLRKGVRACARSAVEPVHARLCVLVHVEGLGARSLRGGVQGGAGHAMGGPSPLGAAGVGPRPWISSRFTSFVQSVLRCDLIIILSSIGTLGGKYDLLGGKDVP